MSSGQAFMAGSLRSLEYYTRGASRPPLLGLSGGRGREADWG